MPKHVQNLAKSQPNLAAKSLAERAGKAPVDAASKRRSRIIGEELDKLAKRERPGKRERQLLRAEQAATDFRRLTPVQPILAPNQSGGWSVRGSTANPLRLLGNTHTRGFHGPGMGKSSRKGAPTVERFSQAGFNSGEKVLYRDGRADPQDKPPGPTIRNRFQDTSEGPKGA